MSFREASMKSKKLFPIKKNGRKSDSILIHLSCAAHLYFQALNDAKRELRFLLVYLHGNDHQETENFCR